MTQVLHVRQPPAGGGGDFLWISLAKNRRRQTVSFFGISLRRNGFLDKDPPRLANCRQKVRLSPKKNSSEARNCPLHGNSGSSLFPICAHFSVISVVSNSPRTDDSSRIWSFVRLEEEEEKSRRREATAADRRGSIQKTAHPKSFQNSSSLLQ